MERLQKVLAHAGVASRRAAEAMIREGRVAVNGRVVTEMGVLVDPASDRIAVDGQAIGKAEQHVYVALNKPPGYVTTVRDERGRPTVMDLLRARARLYPVGRLDADSEGLLLLTNDGELALHLTHPRHLVDKEYLVLVAGFPSETTLQRLREGVPLEEGPTAPATVERLQREGEATWLKIIIHEGRKRQIRRMVHALGGRVLRLVRVRVGSVRLGDLELGKWRYLRPEEVRRLKDSAT